MQRPSLFHSSKPSLEGSDRDLMLQTRRDYGEVDRAVKDMKERMAAVQKQPGDRPGHVKMREGHWLGNYGRLFVNSELHFHPETGIPSRFYQYHEGTGETYQYSNQDGVETLVSNPTAAGVRYVLDHNQGVITILRQQPKVVNAPSGGFGGVYAAGVARREQKRQECEIMVEAALATGAGVLFGAGLGLAAGSLVGAALS